MMAVFFKKEGFGELGGRNRVCVIWWTSVNSKILSMLFFLSWLALSALSGDSYSKKRFLAHEMWLTLL